MKQRLLEEIKKDETLLHFFYIIQENNTYTLQKNEKVKEARRIIGRAFPFIQPKKKKELIEGFFPLDVNEYFFYNSLVQDIDFFLNDKEKAIDLIRKEIEENASFDDAIDIERSLKLQIEDREDTSTYYLESLEKLKERLDLDYIRNAILVYLDLAYSNNTNITNTIGTIFYLIEDFTSQALPKKSIDGLRKDLLIHVKEIIEAEEVEEEDINELDINLKLSKEEYFSKQEKIDLSNKSKLLRRYYSNNIKGKLLNRTREEMLKKGSLEDPIKAISNLLLIDVEALEPNEVIEYLKIFIAQVISYSAECKKTYTYWKASDLTNIFKENRFTFSYDIERVRKELETFCKKATKKINKLEPGKVDEDTKEAVLEVIKAFANDKTIKALKLEEEETSKEYIKINTSPYNLDITEANKVLQYATSPRLLETKEESLKRLEAKENPTKKDLRDIEDLKKEIEEKNAILEEIKDLEDNQKKLEKKYSTAQKEEQEDYKRLLKDNAKRIKQTKALVSNANFLQLTMDYDLGESVFIVKEGNVSAQIKQQILENNQSHGLVDFVRYIEDQVYYKYKENWDGYLLIDVEDYTDFLGLDPGSYKEVRKTLKSNINIAFEEVITLTGKYSKAPIDLDINDEFRLITEKITIKPSKSINGITNDTGKTTFIIQVSPRYSKILFNEKALYWASVPRILNRQNKVAKALGYFFYEDIRRNLRGDDYKRTYKLGTIIKQLEKERALQTNSTNKYSARVIKPLQEALNTLEDAGLIEYSTNAFEVYDNELAGKLEDTIKRVFEEERLEVVFKKIDTEAYEKIKERNNRQLLTNKKKKTRK